ncbi:MULTISPECIES: phosphatase PAP2 family protein [unclassified Spirosoma]|uniref:phosphatase PAP2 family protein n=1 Tax=unclassified Spirosoma TaxID=2621999 RepID=UPI00096784DA|nr:MULTISPECIES: phosphatase PAP2 family protein [unclassified Spirosoma]MBN8826576.1 phosphatase PAP2 family protein [Spirosoma sp.]OJW72850.1 MAG: phosphatase PAP2 family protein [Spirosoma sp. 48-14]
MTTNQLQHHIHHRFGRLAKHFPRFVGWLAERLSTDHFRGLPLTVLAGLMVVNVMVLSEITENLVNSEPMVQVDHGFTQWLFRERSTPVSQLLYALTWLGSAYVTIGLTLIGSFVLYRQKKGRNMVILWILMAGVGLFVQVGKRTFIRARPTEVAYYTESGYSFPSGHSATAMTLYGLLGYWLVRGRRRIQNQWLVGICAIGLILVVGFSRIYLGVHFLSDVLGGYLVGACWLIVGIVLTEWQRTTHSTPVG